MKDQYMAVAYTSPEITTMTTRYLLGSTTLYQDFRMNHFRFNAANEFTCSGGFGMIDLNGWPRLFWQHDYYYGGGDSIRELVEK